MRLLLATAAAFALSACAATPDYGPPIQQFSLTDEYFRNKTTVEDGALDTLVTFTTKPGFVHNYGSAARLSVDTFLRGYINKETRERQFEVYQLVKYTDDDPRSYRTARYDTPNGQRSIEVTVFWTNADCPPRAIEGCIFEEHIGFSVSQDLLRQIAGTYGEKRGRESGWAMKFIPTTGSQFQTLITAAEVKGLLDRMDDYEQTVMNIDTSGEEV